MRKIILIVFILSIIFLSPFHAKAVSPIPNCVPEGGSCGMKPIPCCGELVCEDKMGGTTGEQICNAKAASVPCPLPEALCSPRAAIEALTKLVLPIATLGLLLVLVYAGFTKLTAAGDPEKEKKAMQIIRAAITGFIIIALAGVIVATLGGLFGFKVLSS